MMLFKISRRKLSFKLSLEVYRKYLIKGENINLEESKLSKREWNELMEAFNLKDKLI